MTETHPLTRRDLRTRPEVPDLALVPACAPPMTRRALREAARPRRRVPTAREIVHAVPIGQQAAAVAVGLVLAGGVASFAAASPDRGTGSPAPTAAVSAAATRAGADAAASARLTGQAAYAAQVRADAADSGRLALTRSDAVLSAAAETLTGTDLSGLETTAAELAALLTEAGVEVTDVVEVGAAIAALPAGPTAAGATTPGTAATPSAGSPAVTPDPGATGQEAAPADPGTATPEPAAPTQAATPAPEAAPTQAATPAPEATTAQAGTAPEATPTQAGTAPAAPAATGTPGSEVAEFDAAVRIMSLAQEVDGLAAEVQAEIDATRAAAEALAANVAEVEAQENGAIPVDLLCAPAFAPDSLLRCDAVAALEDLNVAFAEEFGEDLDVVSAYRDYATQVTTRYRRGGLAARPGTSNHGLGLAVDLGDFGRLGYFGAPFYEWMSENSEAYGWFHPEHMGPGGSGPREPWHWEFDPALLEGGESTPLPGTD